MRHPWRILAALTLGAAACREVAAPTPVTPAAPLEHVTQAAARDEGRYPTEEEFAASGGGPSGLFVTTPESWFLNDATYNARARITWSWVNSVSVAMDMRVTNASGALVNSGGASFGFSHWIPYGAGDTTITASIGTQGHNCGHFGDTRVTGRGSLMLIRNPQGISEVWSGAVDASAPQSWQGSCPVSTPRGGGGTPDDGQLPPPDDDGRDDGGDRGDGGTWITICYDYYEPEWWWDENTGTGGVNYFYSHTECVSSQMRQSAPGTTTLLRASRPAIAEPSAVTAAHATAAPRPRIVLAVASLPAGRAVASVRRRDGSDADLVLVDAARATAAELAATLEDLPHAPGSSGARDLAIVAKTARPVPPGKERAAADLLARLRTAPLIAVRGIGRYPGLRLSPPTEPATQR